VTTAPTSVTALSISGFLEWLGATAVLPLLPLFLKEHGCSDGMIGAIIGVFFFSGVVLAYPLGKISEVSNKKVLLIASLLSYGLSNVVFIAPVGPIGYLAARGLQGAGMAAIQVVSLSWIGEESRSGSPGRAYGFIFGSQAAGTAIGPLLGSMLGLSVMPVEFLLSGLVVASAALPIMSGSWRNGISKILKKETANSLIKELVGGSRERMGSFGPEEPSVSSSQFRQFRQFRQAVSGVLLVALASGVLVGTDDACWSLLMQHKGAISLEIGLSWTMYAIPLAVASVPAGALSDILSPRLLTIVTLLALAACLASYPFLPKVWMLLVISAVQGVIVAFSYPALQATVLHLVSGRRLGRWEGIVASAQTLATAVGAVVAGTFYASSIKGTFVGTAVIMVVLTMSACCLWWTSTVHST